MSNDEDSGLMNRAASKLKSGAKKAGKRTWEDMKKSAAEAGKPSKSRRSRKDPDPPSMRAERDAPRFGEDAEDYDDYDEGVGMTGGLGTGMEGDGDPLSFGGAGGWGMSAEAEDEYDDWLGGW